MLSWVLSLSVTTFTSWNHSHSLSKISRVNNHEKLTSKMCTANSGHSGMTREKPWLVHAHIWWGLSMALALALAVIFQSLKIFFWYHHSGFFSSSNFWNWSYGHSNNNSEERKNQQFRDGFCFNQLNVFDNNNAQHIK